jgi:hypothetical protein
MLRTIRFAAIGAMIGFLRAPERRIMTSRAARCQ